MPSVKQVPRLGINLCEDEKKVKGWSRSGKVEGHC
jgi:hypothetical protein